MVRRQVASYFYSPLGYVMMAAFLFISGIAFCRALTQSLEERIKVGDLLFSSPLFWIMVLVVLTVLTLQSFGEEKHLGTLETLLTAPVSDTQVVLAKYTAALLFFMILCLPLALYPWILRAQAGGVDLDPVPFLTGYALLFLIASCYTAFGLMISAASRQPAAGGLFTFTGLCLAFFSDTLLFAVRGERLEKALTYLSTSHQIVDFSQGIIDTRPIILYVSGTALFLFAAIKALEARHWK